MDDPMDKQAAFILATKIKTHIPDDDNDLISEFVQTVMADSMYPENIHLWADKVLKEHGVT